MDAWNEGWAVGAAASWSLEQAGAEYFDVVGWTLSQAIPGDAISWNGFDLKDGTVSVVSPPLPWSPGAAAEMLAAVMVDHPITNSFFDNMGDLSPRRISDVISPTRFRRTVTYNELFRHMQADAQIIVCTSSPASGHANGWGVNRIGRDFTDDECRLLRALQPTLAALEKRALHPADDGRAPWRVGDATAERFGLTAREREVLEFLAAGTTPRSMSHLMRISERTVRKHLENAYAKLGCHDRLAALRILGALPSGANVTFS